jgi:methyl-accepting chemotaxis protein
VKLSVRTKLIGAFLAIVALMAGVGAVSISRLDHVNSITEVVGKENLDALRVVQTIDGQLRTFREQQLTMLELPDQGARTGMLDGLASLQNTISVLLENGEERPTARAEREIGADLNGAWKGYLEATAPGMAAIARGDLRAASAAFTGGAAADAFSGIGYGTQAALDYQQGLARDKVAQSTDSVSKTRTLVIVLLAGVALVAMALALWLSRAIVGGVRQLVRAARGIASGDVEQRVTVSSRDEIGEAAEAFGAMVAYLEEAAAAAKAIAAGDLSVEVEPKSESDALGHAFAEMSAQLREALGDQSCLEDLVERMEALSAHDLAELETALAAVARGDLTVDAEPTTPPLAAAEGRAVGRLAEIFNAMLERTRASVEGYNAMRARVEAMLREIARETQAVSVSAQQMATTSEEAGRAVGEIAAGVGEVAAGAERQVRTVDEARRLTEEVVSATRASAGDAEETARVAEEARAVAEAGASTVAEATHAMEAVRDSSAQATEAIRALGEKSERIGGIVSTITGIAEQTNLLALNAAIEAARAGEQGRGFAVVAEEVRKLAEESQQAARSIGGLIDEIQQETGRAVSVVEGGARQTEEGVQTVEQARASFERIGGSVADMTLRIEAIAGAVSEAAERAVQMEENMAVVVTVAEQSSATTEQVSASTEETSASGQEIAASAQELARTVDQLERLVGQFTLDSVPAGADLTPVA